MLFKNKLKLNRAQKIRLKNKKNHKYYLKKIFHKSILNKNKFRFLKKTFKNKKTFKYNKAYLIKKNHKAHLNYLYIF